MFTKSQDTRVCRHSLIQIKAILSLVSFKKFVMLEKQYKLSNRNNLKKKYP